MLQDRSDRQKSLLEELAAADEEGLKEKALSLENRRVTTFICLKNL